MKSGWSNTVVSAIVGGVVGALVATVCGSFMAPKSFDKLKVGELVVSDKIMLWEDGKDGASLLVQNGGIWATTRVIGQQICGNAILANCVLTTPDPHITPLDQCTIYTEMGSSTAEGGLLMVRSPDGGNVIANQEGVKSGSAYVITFDPNGVPVTFLRKNDNGARLLSRFIAPRPGHEHETFDVSIPPELFELMQQQAAAQQQGQPQGQMSENPMPTGEPTMGNMPPGTEQSAMNQSTILH